MPDPAYLQGVVVLVKVVGCELQVAVAKQWPIVVGIRGRRIGGRQHRSERYQVDVAPCSTRTAIVELVSAPISHITDFQQSLERCLLINVYAPTVRIGLFVIV